MIRKVNAKTTATLMRKSLNHNHAQTSGKLPKNVGYVKLKYVKSPHSVKATPSYPSPTSFTLTWPMTTYHSDNQQASKASSYQSIFKHVFSKTSKETLATLILTLLVVTPSVQQLVSTHILWLTRTSPSASREIRRRRIKTLTKGTVATSALVKERRGEKRRPGRNKKTSSSVIFQTHFKPGTNQKHSKIGLAWTAFAQTMKQRRNARPSLAVLTVATSTIEVTLNASFLPDGTNSQSSSKSTA